MNIISLRLGETIELEYGCFEKFRSVFCSKHPECDPDTIDGLDTFFFIAQRKKNEKSFLVVG